MNQKIRIGIVGYGNLGKGAELAIQQNHDMELVAVFSRRALTATLSGVPAVPINEAGQYRDKIDVMLLCGGSATDLVEQGPHFAAMFNTVDSFDTHAKIPEYFESMNKTAKAAGKVAAISIGWDPGLFSLNRMIAGAVLPQGTDHTFWGKGVSQGHSDAIRRIAGVKDAKQYTVPKQEIIAAVRDGQNSDVPSNEAHTRECYVVAEIGADLAAIETAIKTMPHYFADYETKVNFISEEEFRKNHAAIPHGGFVFRTGETSPGVRQRIEFALKLDSNPEFTASVLAAYGRAVFRLAQHGFTGANTVFDIPPGWLSPKPADELRRELL
jgi:diaminopimelate dehydrogenase